KNIKFLAFAFLAVLLAQPVIGQNSVDENGRLPGFTRAAVEVEVDDKAKTRAVYGNDDADIPGSYPKIINGENPDLNFPADFDALADEVNASQVDARISELETELQRLMGYNEQLRLENRAIKKSLNNCCSSTLPGLAIEDAYLLQNAPNPFKQTTVVNYFIPENATGARLDIRDVKGELIETINIQNGGFGNIDLAAETLQAGTYVYSLYIGEEIIDSKVMIITQ
ncbi:MAG: T9SS type A sorting domain-containing protein, partial [Bacteroidota bacterium]